MGTSRIEFTVRDRSIPQRSNSDTTSNKTVKTSFEDNSNIIKKISLGKQGVHNAIWDKKRRNVFDLLSNKMQKA